MGQRQKPLRQAGSIFPRKEKGFGHYQSMINLHHTTLEDKMKLQHEKFDRVLALLLSKNSVDKKCEDFKLRLFTEEHIFL
jgi:hypothetical protein